MSTWALALGWANTWWEFCGAGCRGVVTGLAADDSVPIVLATPGAAKGLLGRALDALAGDGGVGRDPSPSLWGPLPSVTEVNFVFVRGICM